MVFQVFPRIWIRVGVLRAFRSNIRTRRVNDHKPLIFKYFFANISSFDAADLIPGGPKRPSQTAFFAGQVRVAPVSGEDIMCMSGMAATGGINDRTG
jgi:hypothetical protein